MIRNDKNNDKENDQVTNSVQCLFARGCKCTEPLWKRHLRHGSAQVTHDDNKVEERTARIQTDNNNDNENNNDCGFRGRLPIHSRFGKWHHLNRSSCWDSMPTSAATAPGGTQLRSCLFSDSADSQAVNFSIIRV